MSAEPRPSPDRGDAPAARGQPPARPVAVLGGGWAGAVAAYRLSASGIPVVVHEAGSVLGGRARRVERSGLAIDNGQHLLMGAYGATLAVLRGIHQQPDADPGLRRFRLVVAPFERSPGPLLEAARLPPPWDLVGGMLRSRALDWNERLAAVRWLRGLAKSRYARPDGETVDGLLAPLPPSVRRLLAPLSLAALNTPTERASSAMFARILGRLAAGRGGTDFLLPLLDLSELLPEAAARRVEARGGEVRLRSTAQVAAIRDDGVDIVATEGQWTASAAIVAVGPHQLEGAFSPGVAALPGVGRAIGLTGALGYEPTTTVWLGFRERLRLPAHIARLDDRPGHWVVDRHDVLERSPEAAQAHALRGFLAIVISAGGPHDDLDAKSLFGEVHAQLRRLRPEFPTPVWSQVIAERRATWSCVPGATRPEAGRIADRLYLAGDYTDPGLPATLEAAVASGERAARALIGDRER